MTSLDKFRFRYRSHVQYYRRAAFVKAFRSARYIYGQHGGHLYIAIKSSFYVEISFIPRMVRECGGYMVSIGSKAENDFVYALVEDEPAFFSVGRVTNAQVSYRNGPMIGLLKDKSGRWKWDSGEPLRYTNWERYQPNNERGKEIYTSLFALRSGKDEMIDVPADKWNDTCCSTHSYVLEFE